MDGQVSTLDSNKREEEGAYIAALKGSKNPPWQLQLYTTSTPLPSVSQVTATAEPSIPGNSVFAGGSGGGSCFKCGKMGHWARDCDAIGGGGGGGGGGGSGGGAERENSDPSVVEKPCPCGVGTCVVFTANTEKNRGRKFYKCPVREENGGCGFFEWCDNSLGTSVSNGAQTKATNSSFPHVQCRCGAAGGGAGNGGSCFKCGKLGHWARDCDPIGRGGGVGYIGGEAERENSDPSMVGKPCACGLGSCLVLTANTEKNRGRKFYRCPIREENGGCGFFEWCDKSLGTPVSNGAQIEPTNSSFPDLHCPCGAGSCFILTAKTGRNIGQQFYRCPSSQGCGFFKWCSEHTPAAGLSISCNGKSSSSCFKCGQEGHWAKDCPKPSSDSSTEGGARSGGRSNSSSCFKCGQGGHWARDCPKPSYDSSTEVVARSGSSGTCYRCSKPGHWARDCPAYDLKIHNVQ